MEEGGGIMENWAVVVAAGQRLLTEMNLAREGWAKREEFDTSLLPSRGSGEGILRVTRVRADPWRW